MKIKTAVILPLLALICQTGLAVTKDIDLSTSQSSLPAITTQTLKMTGLANRSLPVPEINTATLKMTGLANRNLPVPEITTATLKMTGLANRMLPVPEVTTAVLKMTGLANRSLPVPEITTVSLKMTGLANRNLPVPEITTAALKMTGLRAVPSPEYPRPGSDQPSADTVRDDTPPVLGGKYTFLVPVELEDMSDEADSFKVVVSVASSGPAIRTLVDEAEKTIRNGSFDGVVSVISEPATPSSGRTLSYKAVLMICHEDSCVSPGQGAPAWARPQPGSSPKLSHEGQLTSQKEVDVPALSMTGNATNDRIQDLPAKRADFDGSLSGEPGLEAADPGKTKLQETLDLPGPDKANESLSDDAPHIKSK